MIAKWKIESWPRQSFCTRGLITEAKPVTLKDVQGAYYALGILICIATFILFCEKLLPNISFSPRKSGQRGSVVQNGIYNLQMNVTNGLPWDTYSPSVESTTVTSDPSVTSSSETVPVDYFGRSLIKDGKEVEYDIFGRQIVKMDQYDLFGRPVDKDIL